MTRIAVFLLALCLAGCAVDQADRRVAMLHSGMARGEVIALLGEPQRVTRHGDLQMLHFIVPRHRPPRDRAIYAVIGRDDRVESIGRDEEP